MRRPSGVGIVALWVARVLMVALVVVVAIALVGCANRTEPESQADRLSLNTVKLDDGRKLVCVVYRPPSGGGVSCDWAGVSK